eukprot:4099437-Heterocapsa_arctica.AAC.1
MGCSNLHGDARRTSSRPTQKTGSYAPLWPRGAPIIFARTAGCHTAHSRCPKLSKGMGCSNLHGDALGPARDPHIQRAFTHLYGHAALLLYWLGLRGLIPHTVAAQSSARAWGVPICTAMR